MEGRRDGSLDGGSDGTKVGWMLGEEEGASEVVNVGEELGCSVGQGDFLSPKKPL